MSLAPTPSSNLSLYSSPPLAKTVPTLRRYNIFGTSSSFFHINKSFSFKSNDSFLRNSSFFSNTRLEKPSVLIARASETDAQTAESKGGEGGGGEEQYEEYEVEIEQPYGLKFAKGRDGGTYIDAIAPGGSADKTGKFTVGDRVLATRFLVFFHLASCITFSIYAMSFMCFFFKREDF